MDQKQIYWSKVMTRMTDELMKKTKKSGKAYYKWMQRQIDLVYHELLQSMKQKHTSHESWVDAIVSKARRKLGIHRMEVIQQAFRKLWKTMQFNEHKRSVVVIESYLAKTSWHAYA
jgi:hypothetical protein